MVPLTPELRARLGMELSARQQEDKELDAAIKALTQSGRDDPIMMQRLKNKKLALKDRIVELKHLLLPDIIS